MGCKVLSDVDYQDWDKKYTRVTKTINDREKKKEKLMNDIEQNLIILGATAIEDKL